MKKILPAIILTLIPLLMLAQSKATDEYVIKQEHVDGQFSLGVRNTGSLFGNNGYSGLGYGGQFRIRIGKRLNTEWYTDYIKTDYGGVGHRETVHIGWSVMFYPFSTSTRKGSFTPYIIAGHCFDYARISANLYRDPGNGTFTSDFGERWTSAVQLGIGSSYYFTDRFDISLSAQYMSHLGNDIRAEVVEFEDKSGKYLQIDNDHQSLTLEGHLLITLSMNYILFDFIKPRH